VFMQRIYLVIGHKEHKAMGSKTKYRSCPAYPHRQPPQRSVHLSDKLVDVDFPVTKVTALDEVLEFTGPPAACGVGELEWPQEVRCLLEVGAGGGDLVDEVFNREDIELAEGFLDDGVVGEGDALLGHLAMSTLIDQLADRFEIRLAVCDVGFDETEHLLGSFCDFDEDAVVDLQETEKLQYFTGLWRDLVDTADTNNKVDLGLGWDVEITR